MHPFPHLLYNPLILKHGLKKCGERGIKPAFYAPGASTADSFAAGTVISACFALSSFFLSISARQTIPDLSFKLIPFRT
jgi:hypothetical protein